VRAVKDHGGITSDEWCSPRSVATPLYHFWGEADLDPCSNDRSVIRSRRALASGGLVLPWDGTTYANWPYSQNDAWTSKALHEMKAGRVEELVILCMTATSTVWWKRLMISAKRNPRVHLTKRLKFLGPGGKPVDSSRFEPALIYYGPRATRFDQHFSHLSMWSTWGRSARA
jgi:DNA N-6-adenine-methyltransferase (Dam)